MTPRYCMSLVGLTLLGVLACFQDAGAQEQFPSRSITIVVPFPPGGTSDILGRSIGQKIGEYTGQTVLIENVSGAGTAIGTQRVAQARPDGYTLLVATTTTFSSNPHLYRKLPYNISQFEPITLLVQHELAVHISPKLPVSTLQELIAYAARTPGGISYSTTGRGSLSEVLGEMMKAAFKVELRDIPYRGAAPALVDVMRGELDMHFDGITSTIPHLRSGRAKVIATTGPERSPMTPNIPTLVDLGYKDLVMENIYVLLAPKGTPRPIVDTLNSLVRRALNDPVLRERLTNQGAIPKPTSPEGLAEVMARDSAYFEKIVRELKIRPVD